MRDQKGEGSLVKRQYGTLLDLFFEGMRNVTVLKVKVLRLKSAFHQVIRVINYESEEFCDEGCQKEEHC